MIPLIFIPFIFILLAKKANSARAAYNMKDYSRFKMELVMLTIMVIIGSSLVIFMQLKFFK